MLLELLGAGLLSARAKGWLALVSALAALGGVLAAWPRLLAGHALEASFGAWDGPIRLAFHVDGLSFLFALMAAGIGTAVLLYAISYMAHERGATRFYALILLFIAGFVHLVYTADLFLLYLSWEAVGLCSFLLVGFWYRKEEAAYGARKVLTMTHLAGYGLLAAVILLYHRTGSTLWTDPHVQGAFSTGLFYLVLVAVMAKSVQFPLHTWIPDAMAAPTPVSALLHAACYVKAGVYLVARLHAFGPWPVSWGMAVSWLGATTLLVGVLCAMAQHDLKRLLAFHSVSQIGYMMLGLGLGTPLGTVPLPEPWAVQERVVPMRRVRPADLWNPRHGPSGRPRPEDAAHDADLAGLLGGYLRSPVVQRLRQQVDALWRCPGGAPACTGADRLDRQPAHRIFLPQGHRRGLPGQSRQRHRGCP